MRRPRLVVQNARMEGHAINKFFGTKLPADKGYDVTVLCGPLFKNSYDGSIIKVDEPLQKFVTFDPGEAVGSYSKGNIYAVANSSCVVEDGKYQNRGISFYDFEPLTEEDRIAVKSGEIKPVKVKPGPVKVVRPEANFEKNKETKTVEEEEFKKAVESIQNSPFICK